MADYTQTIANALVVIGSPTTKWNSMVWGTDYWGDGYDHTFHTVYKGLANSTVQTTAVGKLIDHGVANDLILTSAVGKTAGINLSNTVVPTEDITERYLFDSAGFSYVFPPSVTDAEDAYIADYSGTTAPSSPWTTATITAPTWS